MQPSPSQLEALSWSGSKAVPGQHTLRGGRGSGQDIVDHTTRGKQSATSKINIPRADIPVMSTTSVHKELHAKEGESTTGSRLTYIPEELPLFGPADPERWPTEKIMFFAGFLLFPCWIFGAFWRSREHDMFADLFRWRCQVMTMFAVIICGGLLITEVASRGR